VIHDDSDDGKNRIAEQHKQFVEQIINRDIAEASALSWSMDDDLAAPRY
jgi:hypothetical protein